MATLNINGRDVTVDVPTDMPILWVLRDVVGLTGTKFGCGMALCGACTVHLDAQPIRSCVTPVSAATGKKITTIEAIGETPAGKKVRQAWLDLEVVQCGYCQSGQIMSASATPTSITPWQQAHAGDAGLHVRYFPRPFRRPVDADPGVRRARHLPHLKAMDGDRYRRARVCGDGGKRTGQGFGVYGAPAGRRGHALTKFSQTV